MPEKFPEPFKKDDWSFYEQHKEEVDQDYSKLETAEQEYNSILEDIDKIFTNEFLK